MIQQQRPANPQQQRTEGNQPDQQRANPQGEGGENNNRRRNRPNRNKNRNNNNPNGNNNEAGV